MKSVQNNQYDAIVIGSGIGGLTAASLLAQLANKRVLVLERHFKLGGFTHTFERKGYSWDVGLHYVGQMAEGEQSRQLFDFITGRGVKWNTLPKDYDHFDYPGLSVKATAGVVEFEQALISQFPHEAAAIRIYLRDIARVNGWLMRFYIGRLMPKAIAALLTLPQRALALQTTQQYLDSHFRDERLKAVLVSQWGDYGLPPAESAFAIHVQIASHYLEGAWYPVGGAGVITDSIQPIIEAAGGACMVNQEVSEIIVEKGSAVGVHTRGRGGVEHTFTAPLIISDAGAYATYTRLLPAELKLPQQRQLLATKQSSSVVVLYVGFKESPASLGLHGENHWIYAGTDHAAMYAQRNGVLEGKPQFAYLSCGSLRDPQAKRHTAQIITYADHECFADWKDKPWLRRGQDYNQLKAKITDGMIDLVERDHPGFRDLIAYTELSTPLTVEHFTGHRQGAIYGVPATPARYLNNDLNIRSPIAGLLLTGTDVASLGIVGAMMGGVLTSAHVLDPRGFMTITSAAARAASVKAGTQTISVSPA